MRMSNLFFKGSPERVITDYDILELIHLLGWRPSEAIALGLEAIAIRLEAIAIWPPHRYQVGSHRYLVGCHRS